MKKILFVISVILLSITTVNASIDGIICIDYPVTNSYYGDNLLVQGWLMANDSNAHIKIYIDDKQINNEITRYERADVIKAISGYGGAIANPTPGYRMNADLSNYNAGLHKVTVSAYTGTNRLIVSKSKYLYVSKNKIRTVIDYPLNNSNYNEVINVQGWLMSTTNISNIKAYIDNELVTYNYIRYERADVIATIKGYGDISNNPTPGFTGEIDISPYTIGTHTLKLEFYSNNNLINTNTKSFSISNNISRIRVDNPKDTLKGDSIYFQGWLMNSNKNNSINFYLDDNLITPEYNSYHRADVITAIKGYGDITINNSSGYNGYIDMSNYRDGSHIFKAVVIDKNSEIIATDERSFTLNKYDTILRLDSPINSYELNKPQLNIYGWYLSTASNTNLEVLLNGEDISDQFNRVKREDAIRAYGKKYGATNETLAGYNGDIDLSGVLDGNVSIIVNVRNSKTNEVLQSTSRSINLKKYKSTMRIDSPINNYNLNGTELNIYGWYLSTSPNSYVELYVNNADKSSLIERNKRNDAVLVYGEEYGANEETIAGYKALVDLETALDGIVNIKVNIKDSITNEILQSISKNIVLHKYESTLRIDSPTNNYNSIGTGLNIQGWSMSTSKHTHIEFYFDDEKKEVTIEKVSRTDALNAYGNIYNITDENVGYNINFDASNYHDGNHTISIRVIDDVTNENLYTLNRVINLKKYDGIICVDYPSRGNFSKDTNLLIQGWALSEDSNSKIRVFIDNQELEITRYERPDVHSVYPTSYGGIEKNPTPGYTTTISLNNYNEGRHNIYIKLYNNMDDVITTKTYIINVYSNIYFGIDVSSHQGNINWNAVSKTGIDFAIIRVGYGDNWTSQDDSKFLDNARGCAENNIPYGIYLYSYATKVNGPASINTDSESSDSEAQHTLRLINSLTSQQKSFFKLPIYIDMEDDSTVHLGKATLTNIADNYCKTIVNSGYKCGIYASKSWLNNYLDTTYLSSKYEIWLCSN